MAHEPTREAAVVLVIFGVMIALYGLVVMPGDGVREIEVCMDDRERPSIGDTCPRVTVEKYVESTLKGPVMIAGGAIVVVGAIIGLTGDPHPDDEE